MKKLLILISFSLLFGCEKTSQNVQTPEALSDGNTVNFETVKKIALINHNELDTVSTKTLKNVEVTVGDSTEIDSNFVIKDKKGRDALHVFKYKNKKGWNIIAGDNRLFPILAYSKNGEAKLDTSLNHGLKFWVEDILLQIDYMDANNIKQSKGIAAEWKKYEKGEMQLKNYQEDGEGGNESGGVYCTPSSEIWAIWDNNINDWTGVTGLTWNQTAGYNYYSHPDYCGPLANYCNKFPAGCGPVAIGMVMRYYQRPISFSFSGTQRTANYGVMPSGIDGIDCSAPTTAVEETAALLNGAAGKYAFDVCTSVNFWPFYTHSESSTALYPWNISQTFSDFGYSSPGNKIDYSSNKNRLISNLKAHQLVIFSGSTCDVCLWNAHIWFCEGLKETISMQCVINDEVYMNWGWGGSDNGWFGVSNSFNTDHHGTYNNANMKIIVDIKP